MKFNIEFHKSHCRNTTNLLTTHTYIYTHISFDDVNFELINVYF